MALGLRGSENETTWIMRTLTELAGRSLRLATRRLRRQSGFSAVVIATIGLAVGLTAGAFAVVDAVLLRPLPYPNADRLVIVQHAAPGAELTAHGASPGLFLHYRAESRVFDDLALYEERVRTYGDGQQPEQLRAGTVSANLFELLGMPPVLGRIPSADEVQAASGDYLVISHELWTRRYGGDPEVLGRRVDLDGATVEIVAVAPPEARIPDAATGVWRLSAFEQHPGVYPGPFRK